MRLQTFDGSNHTLVVDFELSSVLQTVQRLKFKNFPWRLSVNQADLFGLADSLENHLWQILHTPLCSLFGRGGHHFALAENGNDFGSLFGKYYFQTQTILLLQV